LHHETTVLLEAPAEHAFAYLDDFNALSAHMEKPSAMMMGSGMRITTDELGGRAVGSKVRMEGRVLGLTLSLDEVVTERRPPWRKAWQTVEAQLLVIGPYRLGFEISPSGSRAALRVFIDYAVPLGWPARWLSRLLAGIYARWCIERMAGDAQRHFDQAR
jgi:hypothetical protein